MAEVCSCCRRRPQTGTPSTPAIELRLRQREYTKYDVSSTDSIIPRQKEYAQGTQAHCSKREASRKPTTEATTTSSPASQDVKAAIDTCSRNDKHGGRNLYVQQQSDQHRWTGTIPTLVKSVSERLEAQRHLSGLGNNNRTAS